MKSLLSLALLLSVFASQSFAATFTTAKSYPCNKPFATDIFLEGTAGKGAANGINAANALPFVDGDLMAIPAGMRIDKVQFIVDVAITGTTDIDVGDDDDSDGYIDGSLSLTLGTPGMYSTNAKVAGAYLRVQTAGVTDAADIYVVPNAKYYTAAGKELKVDVTGTNTAGKGRVHVEGWMFCSNS